MMLICEKLSKINEILWFWRNFGVEFFRRRRKKVWKHAFRRPFLPPLTPKFFLQPIDIQHRKIF